MENTANSVTPDISTTPQPNIDAPAINAPKQPSFMKVKYPDGREEDWDQAKVQERIQKSIGLEKRVADADRYEKAFSSLVAKLQDPREVINLLNHADLKFTSEKRAELLQAMLESGDETVEEATKKWLYEKRVKPSLMDPKDRKVMEMESEVQKLRDEKLERARLEKEAEDAKQQEQIKTAFRQKMGEAITKAGLPFDDDLSRQIMNKARLYTRIGQMPDWDNCVKLVQQDFLNNAKAILGKVEVERILDLLDGETAQKINKALMKAVDKKVDAPAADPKLKKKDDKSGKDFQEWLRNVERGRV